MFPILSVKDLHEFVDLAGRFSIERLYATVFVEEKRPRFPDPTRAQEVQVHRFLTMILTAPAEAVSGIPTVLRFMTTHPVLSDEDETRTRCAYLTHLKAVEIALSVTSCRGYLTFLGDPSIIPGSLNGLDPALLKAAEEALTAEYGAMAGSEVTRDRLEDEKAATGLESCQEAPSEAPEDPPTPPEPVDSTPGPVEVLETRQPEAPESDTVSLSDPAQEEGHETGGLPEEPVVRTLADISAESAAPSLEAQFGKGGK